MIAIIRFVTVNMILVTPTYEVMGPIFIVFCSIWIIGSIIIIVRTKKKDREKRKDSTLNYYIKYDNNLYKVTLRKDFKDRVINSIVCDNTNQILYVGGDDADDDTYCSVTEEDGLDFTGFYQFPMHPTKGGAILISGRIKSINISGNKAIPCCITFPSSETPKRRSTRVLCY